MMETAQHGKRFDTLATARAYAQAHALREKAVCYIVRGAEVLVFDHIPDQPIPDGGSGVQVVAGGLEPGETPQQAALRESCEETGRSGFVLGGYLGSFVWLNTQHAKRELRHFIHLTAPAGLPDIWQHHADGHLFAFRWMDIAAPGLDWEMDACLPVLATLSNSNRQKV